MNFFNQVGQISQNLGHTLGSSVNQALERGLATGVPEELRVGSHTVVVKEKIAEGGFGLIVLVNELHTQREMVLKRCNIDRENVFEIVKKEINILQRFAGPYVTKLIESDIQQIRSSREALLLLEYYPGGHLLDRLNSRHGSLLPAESIYRIFGQILQGVRTFHENNPPIINRDLKLENILFGLDGKVRLCDFGSCEESPIYVRNQSEREKVEEAIQKETTQMYRAPEMINLYMRDHLTEKTDIWALGCIFYALCFLKHPFQDQGSLAIQQAKYVLPKEMTVSSDAIEFLHRMLDIDPEARCTVGELLKALVEVAAGRPIPPHNLSEEALRRREERIAADQLRDSKMKKKNTAPPPPAKKGAPPASNSVAAKRLAAKRGGAVPTTPSGHIDFSSTQFSSSGGGEFAANFDDFESTPSSYSVTPVASTKTPGGSVRRPSNEDFFDSAPVQFNPHISQPVASVDDFFSDSPAAVSFNTAPAASRPQGNATTSSFVDFDADFNQPISIESSAAANSSFDPFNDTNEPDPFHQPVHQTHKSSAAASTFDAFNNDSDDFIAIKRSSNAASSAGVRRPSNDNFHATTTAHSFNGFDEFADTPAFPSSAPATQTKPAPTSASALLFGSVDHDITPPQPPSTRQNSTVSYDLQQGQPHPALAADGFFGSSDFGFDLPPAPVSRQNSVANGPGSGRGSFGNAEVGFDFGSPPAPVSRQNSTNVRAPSFSNFGGSGFDDFPSSSSSSQQSHPPAISAPAKHAAPAPPRPDFDSILPPAVTLTPTVQSAPLPASSYKSTTTTTTTNKNADLLGDLLDTPYPSTSQQRKSIGSNELLSLYDQPKNDPFSNMKQPVMLTPTNNNFGNALPFIPPNAAGMGMPMNNNNNNPNNRRPSTMMGGAPPAMAVPSGYYTSPPMTPAGMNSITNNLSYSTSTSGYSSASTTPYSTSAANSYKYGGPGTAGGMGGMPSSQVAGQAPMQGGGNNAGNPNLNYYANPLKTNPNAMKPNYGKPSDPFDSLNVMK